MPRPPSPSPGADATPPDPRSPSYLPFLRELPWLEELCAALAEAGREVDLREHVLSLTAVHGLSSQTWRCTIAEWALRLEALPRATAEDLVWQLLDTFQQQPDLAVRQMLLNLVAEIGFEAEATTLAIKPGRERGGGEGAWELDLLDLRWVFFHVVRHVAELLSLRPAAAERVEAFWTLHAVLAGCRAPDCLWYQFIARKLEEKAEAGALAPRSREVRSLMHALGQPPRASAARWSVLNVFRPTPLAASWAEERELVFADATWDLGSAPGAGAFVCRLVHALLLHVCARRDGEDGGEDAMGDEDEDLDEHEREEQERALKTWGDLRSLLHGCRPLCLASERFAEFMVPYALAAFARRPGGGRGQRDRAKAALSARFRALLMDPACPLRLQLLLLKALDALRTLSQLRSDLAHELEMERAAKKEEQMDCRLRWPPEKDEKEEEVGRQGKAYWLDIGYLDVVAVALRCSAGLTALFYVEAWVREQGVAEVRFLFGDGTAGVTRGRLTRISPSLRIPAVSVQRSARRRPGPRAGPEAAAPDLRAAG